MICFSLGAISKEVAANNNALNIVGMVSLYHLKKRIEVQWQGICSYLNQIFQNKFMKNDVS